MKARSRILLISNSTVHGRGYLDHVENEIKNFIGPAMTILFFPFALFDRDDYAAKAKARFAAMGFALASAHTIDNPSAAVEKTDAIFIGGGNTFRLLKALQDLDLLERDSPQSEKRRALHRQQRRLECRRSDNQNDQGHADRSAAFVRFVRPGSISDQSALSRPRSEFNSHGRNPGRTHCPIPRRK